MTSAVAIAWKPSNVAASMSRLRRRLTLQAASRPTPAPIAMPTAIA